MKVHGWRVLLLCTSIPLSCHIAMWKMKKFSCCFFKGILKFPHSGSCESGLLTDFHHLSSSKRAVSLWLFFRLDSNVLCIIDGVRGKTEFFIWMLLNFFHRKLNLQKRGDIKNYWLELVMNSEKFPNFQTFFLSSFAPQRKNRAKSLTALSKGTQTFHSNYKRTLSFVREDELKFNNFVNFLQH